MQMNLNGAIEALIVYHMRRPLSALNLWQKDGKKIKLSLGLIRIMAKEGAIYKAPAPRACTSNSFCKQERRDFFDCRD